MTDLVVSGTTTTLNGIYNYGTVQIINSGILYVTAYNGTTGTGMIEIHASNILIDGTSSIIADTRGYRGGNSTAGNGEGPGAGSGGGFAGSGAGYGGKGGDTSYTGGPAYGTTSGTDIQIGSGGACGVYFSSYGTGGNGGGSIALYAYTITINGTISTNAGDGATGSGQHGSGGGSGGGILINGKNVRISGTLRASGGNGSSASVSPRYGGGGGGGGRIKVFYGNLSSTATITTNGGSGGAGNGGPTGQNGFPGTYASIFQYWFDPNLMSGD